MIKVLDQQENYLLLTDGAKHFTVVEHRDGKFYSLRNSARHGLEPDDAGFAELIYESGSFTEPEARRLLADVASQWRDLFEHIR